MELWEQQIAIDRELNESLSTLVENGKKACDTERIYRKEKSKAILKLKREGYPATLIQDIVKGLDDIADLGFERDMAQVLYKANVDTINVRKLELRTLQEFINKEYSND